MCVSRKCLYPSYDYPEVTTETFEGVQHLWSQNWRCIAKFLVGWDSYQQNRLRRTSIHDLSSIILTFCVSPILFHCCTQSHSNHTFSLIEFDWNLCLIDYCEKRKRGIVVFCTKKVKSCFSKFENFSGYVFQ